jgi:hypothetical protein
LALTRRPVAVRVSPISSCGLEGPERPPRAMTLLADYEFDTIPCDSGRFVGTVARASESTSLEGNTVELLNNGCAVIFFFVGLMSGRRRAV